MIEYAGKAVRALSMEGRMTVCNMSIEAGARAGLIAPDETTFAYLKGRPLAPKAHEWEMALDFWRSLPSDEGATYDKEVVLDAANLSCRRSPGVPARRTSCRSPARSRTQLTSSRPARRAAAERALKYMGLEGGSPISRVPVDKVFIGSCTNGRIEDLRAVAVVVEKALARGRKVADGVYAMIVPGSGLVKLQAEDEGLDRLFREAGFDWREPGCSMCLAMNADRLEPGERCASTSNRNFEGRQGRGGRTHLVSPAMAAAAAIEGRLADVRELG